MAFRSKSNWDYSGFADWKERELTDEELADDENYRKAMDQAVKRYPLANGVFAYFDAAANRVVEQRKIVERAIEYCEFKAFQECPNCFFDNYHWIGTDAGNGYHWRICTECNYQWRQK